MLRRSLHVMTKILVILSFLLPTLGIHAQFLFSQKNKAAQQQQLEQMKLMRERAQSQTEVLNEDSDVSKSSSTPSSKKPGTVRIGIVLPVTNFEDGKLSQADALRKAQAQLLGGPGVEVISLRSALPTQVDAEAKLTACDFVLTSSVSQQELKAQGRFSRLGGMRTLQMATTAAQFIPGVQATAMLANAAMSTLASQATAQSLSHLASSVKANSEITFAYTLRNSEGTQVAADKIVARSKTDGEDVMTPALTSAAQKIMASMKEATV